VRLPAQGMVPACVGAHFLLPRNKRASVSLAAVERRRRDESDGATAASGAVPHLRVSRRGRRRPDRPAQPEKTFALVVAKAGDRA
jgi:hypothetical protein